VQLWNIPPTWIVVGLAIVGSRSVLARWWRRRRALAAIEYRGSLDDDAFYARYYGDSKLPKGLALQLLHEVAETLKIQATKVRPDDRFGKEIGNYWITSEDLDVLAAKGRERAKTLGAVVDLQKLSTVDEYIRCFANQTAS
jgi:hypothetical protein